MELERLRSIQKQAANGIMGAYMTGCAKGVAYLGQSSYGKLGEMFTTFDESATIDLYSTPLVDINKLDSAPISGGIISNLITRTNKKLESEFNYINHSSLGESDKIKIFMDFANTLQKTNIPIAFAEGEVDDDLKQDIRVLLKEAKNEFIKREQEEQKQEDDAESKPDLDPELEDDSNSTDVDYSQGGDEDAQEPTEDNAEEGFEDDSEEDSEDKDYSQDGEESEEEEEQTEEEDFEPEEDKDSEDPAAEIPTGKMENYFYNSEKYDILSFGELGLFQNGKDHELKVAQAKKNEFIEEAKSLSKKSLDIQADFLAGRMKDESNSNTLLDKMFRSYHDLFFKWIMPLIYDKQWVAMTIYRPMALFLGRVFFHSWFLLKYTINPDYDADYAYSNYEAFLNMTRDSLRKASHDDRDFNDGKLTYGKITSARDRFIKSIWETISAARLSGEKAAKKAKATGKAESMFNYDKFVDRRSFAEAYGLDLSTIGNKKDFERELEKRNFTKSYAEEMKFDFRGNVVTSSPIDMKRMVNSLLDLEKTSTKAISESAGLGNYIEDPTLQAKQKELINTIAVVLATRNKYGFR